MSQARELRSGVWDWQIAASRLGQGTGARTRCARSASRWPVVKFTTHTRTDGRASGPVTSTLATPACSWASALRRRLRPRGGVGRARRHRGRRPAARGPSYARRRRVGGPAHRPRVRRLSGKLPRSRPRLAVRCVVALDRVGDRARPLAVVDPVHMANDVLVRMDRLGQGNIQPLAYRFRAFAALRGPLSAPASGEQRPPLRRVGRPLVHFRTSAYPLVVTTHMPRRVHPLIRSERA